MPIALLAVDMLQSQHALKSFRADLFQRCGIYFGYV